MHPKRKDGKKVVAELEAQVFCLEQRLNVVSSANSSLVFKSGILSAWLECLQIMQTHCQLSAITPISPQFENAYKQLQQQQRELLSQLQASDESPLTTAAAVMADNLVHDTIAPPNDIMAFFRELVSSPILPEVYTITAVEYAKQHRDLAQALAVHLQQLQNPFAQNVSSLLSIKQLLRRHYQLMLGLIISGRSDVVEAPKVYNLESMMPLQPEEMDNQASIPTAVLPALDLTASQEELTAYAMELNQLLMAPVVLEIQSLQKQLDAHLHRHNNQTATLEAGSATNGAEEALTAAPWTVLHRDLDTPQRLVARLNILYKKQYQIIAATTAVFVSSLTWQQAAKMIVYRWPYAANMQYVAKAVAQQWAHKQLYNTLQQFPPQQQHTQCLGGKK